MEDVSTEVVVNVGRAVSVLLREGAAALVSERFASLLEEVAAAAALSLVVDMMGGGWGYGRPDGYLSRVDAGVMHGRLGVAIGRVGNGWRYKVGGPLHRRCEKCSVRVQESAGVRISLLVSSISNGRRLKRRL